MALRREDYRAIKQMNREQMEAYLTRLYNKGIKAGMQQVLSMADKVRAASPASPADQAAPEVDLPEISDEAAGK